MESGHTKLGILASAAISAGLIASAAQAQSASDFKLESEPPKSGPPPVAFQLYPLPKLNLGRDFSESSKQRLNPQVQIILPQKDYYNQRDEHSIPLWDGASAKMKGPMKVRVTIHFH